MNAADIVIIKIVPDEIEVIDNTDGYVLSSDGEKVFLAKGEREAIRRELREALKGSTDLGELEAANEEIKP